jgi:RecJ-like exonuclease
MPKICWNCKGTGKIESTTSNICCICGGCGYIEDRVVYATIPQNQSALIQNTPPMSKRLYLAGMAMQGLLANPERYKYIAGLVDSGKLTQEEATAKNIRKAFYFADELLRQESES